MPNASPGLVASLPQGSVRWHREFILDRRRLCQLLSAADAYVLSSRQEGFAVAPLEAMACGLPVVATDVSGIPDLIEDGGAAFARMVPRDNPGALANAISDMLGDIDATRHMGRAAIAHVERYAFEQIGKRIDAMLSNTTLVA
jgi:glycosyltransferase involved in cell wall biosynthesis